jgi:hypothetical protein
MLSNLTAGSTEVILGCTEARVDLEKPKQDSNSIFLKYS